MFPDDFFNGDFFNHDFWADGAGVNIASPNAAGIEFTVPESNFNFTIPQASFAFMATDENR